MFSEHQFNWVAAADDQIVMAGAQQAKTPFAHFFDQSVFAHFPQNIAAGAPDNTTAHRGAGSEKPCNIGFVNIQTLRGNRKRLVHSPSLLDVS
ncbi:MAG: hypothetical protein AAGH17_04550 [Pseudomonadota bacterium]